MENRWNWQAKRSFKLFFQAVRQVQCPHSATFLICPYLYQKLYPVEMKLLLMPEIIESYFNYNVIGEIFFNSATPPCFTCGFGTTCRYGGPARWMSPEEFENFNEITPEMFQNFEDHPAIVAACETLSQQVKQAIADLSKQSQG